jgi:tetratricopeptide (TPR) repeat protein
VRQHQTWHGQKRYFLLALIVLPAVLYANALSNSFHYDDLHSLVNNPHIRSSTFLGGLAKIPDFFTSGQYYSGETHRVSHYRPLLYTTYVVNYAVTGLSPTGFRAVNLGLHIGCVIMVYFLALYLLGQTTGAFLAALTFAIHPLFSEPINYISARSSLLATFFYLLAFYYFVKVRGGWSVESKWSWVRFSLFTLFMVLAFLSKEITFTLPLMMAAYDLLFTRPRGVKQALETALPYLPLVFMAIFLSYEINLMQYFKDIYLSNEFKISYSKAILAQIEGFILTIRLFFLPIGLSIDHEVFPPAWLLEIGVIGAVFLLIGALALVFFLVSSRKSLVLPFFWFIIASLPTTLIPLNVPLLEHRGYLPGVGLAIVLGWILASARSMKWFVTRRKYSWWSGEYGAWIFLCIMIFAYYAGETLHRNIIWKNEITLWSDAVSKAPGSDRSWTNLGLAYLADRDHDRAIKVFKQALLINPNAVVARVGIGSSYHLQGKLEEAIKAYREAITLQPGYFLPYFNLGVAYQQQGLFEQALNVYQQALTINAHHPETHLNLGSIYLALGKQDLAISEYQESLKLNPELADAHYNLGAAYEMAGQTELASLHYGEAERLRRRNTH